MALVTQRKTALNIVFVNLDWKATRHATLKATQRNKPVLEKTIASIVAHMHPDIICMCEVGEAHIPISPEHMKNISEWSKAAWKRTATGRECQGYRSAEFSSQKEWQKAQDAMSVASLYEQGVPYMTLYNMKTCSLLDSKIVQDLYKPKFDEPRTAQHMLFQASLQRDDVLEIVNVHAPSGSQKRQLTALNRQELIRNLLQIPSLQNPKMTLGLEGKFVVGGDMNTPPSTLSDLLSTAYFEKRVSEQPLIRPHGMAKDVKSGDYCFMLGICSELLSKGKAQINDHRHDPYGIKWMPAFQHASSSNSMPADSTERTTGTPATIQKYTDLAQTGDSESRPLQEPYSGEQQPLLPAGLTLTAVPDCYGEQSDTEIMELEVQSAHGAAETCRSIEVVHEEGQTSGHVNTLEVGPNEAPLNRAEELVYTLVNAMLNKAAYNNTAAEEVIEQVLENQKSEHDLTRQIQSIEKVFGPVVYDFGTKKQYEEQPEHWKAKLPSCIAACVEHWHNYAGKREHCPELKPFQKASEDQYKAIHDAQLHQYWDQRPDLRNANRVRSNFCARLRDETGDKRIAYAIWKHGIPELSRVGDRITTSEPLLPAVKQELETDTSALLHWLFTIAGYVQKQTESSAETQARISKRPVLRSKRNCKR